MFSKKKTSILFQNYFARTFYVFMKRAHTLYSQFENDGYEEHTVLGKLYEVDEEHASEQLPYLVSQLVIGDYNPSKPLFMLIRARYYPVRRRDNEYFYFDEGGRPTFYAVHCSLDNLISIMKTVEHPFDTFNYTNKSMKYSDDILIIFDNKKSLQFNDEAHGRERSRKGITKITHIGFFTTPFERSKMIVPLDTEAGPGEIRYDSLNTDAAYARAIFSEYPNIERFVPGEGYRSSERKGLFFGFKLNKVKMEEDTEITRKWKELINKPEYLEKFQIPFGQEEKLKEEEGPVSSLYNFSIPCLLNAVKDQIDENDFKFLQDRKIIYGVGAKTRDFRKYLTSRGYFIRSFRVQPVGDSFKINSDCYPKKSKEETYIPSRIVKIMFWNEHWMPYDHDLLCLLEKSYRQGYLQRCNAYEFAQQFSNYSYDKMIKFDEKLFFQQHENGFEFNSEFDYDTLSYKEPDTPKYIIFADFECSVNEEFHKPYLISYEGIIVNNAEKDEYVDWIPPTSIFYHFNMESVGYLFLENINNIAKRLKINKSIRIYFYNLHYDFTFLLEYLSNVERLVKENTLYSVSAIFKDTRLEFWDALPLFRTTLKKAANDYLTPIQKQTIRKEIFPYTLYTFDFFKDHPNNLCPIGEFASHLNRDQIVEFQENLPMQFINNEDNIDYVEYAKFYCCQDVACLKNIMINFAKLLNGNNVEGISGTLPFKLNLWHYRTASSIGYDYFKRTVLLKQEKKKFTPLYNWCFPKGVLRHLIQRTIRGGRVMTRDNKKWHYFAESIEGFLQDYDFVSLYPTAMYLLWVTDGFPELIKGEYNQDDIKRLFCPPEMNIEDENNYPFKDGCIHVVFINTKKARHFPNLCIKDEKTKLNNYVNYDNKKVDTWVNVIDVFNLIEYQNAEIKWDGAVVWRGNRHYEIRESIKNLFEFRKNNKKHPIQLVVKLILNSIFGKSILKPVDKEKVYVEKVRYRSKIIYNCDNQWLEPIPCKKYIAVDNWQEYFNANAYRIHRFEDAGDKYMDVELYKRDMSSSFNIFGSNVLAMARRVIGRVMTLAEDIEECHPEMCPGIFYTDTDSMHIRSDLLKLVEEEFKNKYGREIKGVELTQCHADFDIPENFKENEKIIGAQESYFLMKKAYCDKLIGDKGSVGYHMRLKGIPTDLVKYGDYKKMYDGESVKYDLLDGHTSFFYENGKVGSRIEMTREIMTRETREKRQKMELKNFDLF